MFFHLCPDVNNDLAKSPFRGRIWMSKYEYIQYEITYVITYPCPDHDKRIVQKMALEQISNFISKLCM